MLVKLGLGISGMSGSVGGVTAARNRSGAYFRNRTIPINRNTQYQAAVRIALSSLAIFWSSLLDAAQRTAWQTYASSIVMKNRLGESTYLTGFNHFIRSNTEIVNRGLALVEDGPSTLSLPEKDATFAVTGSVATQNLSVVFDNTLDWAGEAGGYLLIYMGTPRNPTRNYFNGPWRYAGKINGASPTPPTSPATIAAPFTLTLGQKFWTYARVLRADGRLSEPFRCNSLVTA